MENLGYYRFPTINRDLVVFVCEDDLWSYDLAEDRLARLTSNYGAVSTPKISPDGKNIAFVGSEDGDTEIYVMPSLGGPAKRLTYLGSMVKVLGWKNNKEILFSSNHGMPFPRMSDIYSVNTNGEFPICFSFGMGSDIAFGKKSIILGKNTADPARWKRYKGGTAGEIWIDKNGTSDFEKLINLKGNLASPMSIDGRVFFLSDHDGIGNIYSCTEAGKTLKQHTYHKNYYARNASSDGKSIVYHSGADIWIYNVSSSKKKKVDIDFRSPRIQKSRKYVSAQNYLEDYALDNQNTMISFTSRGKVFTMGNWDGPVFQLGETQGVRYRFPRFFKKDQKVLVFSDKNGEDRIEIHHFDGSKKIKVLNDLNVGRPYEVKMSPKEDKAFILNHKHELLLLDLKKDKLLKVDHSKHAPIHGADWAPDGKYIAYDCSLNRRSSVIKIYDIKKKKKYTVSEPVLSDFQPVFDPSGKYLTFLSGRVFNPVYDNLQFDLGFPSGIKPYILTLSSDTLSPLVKEVERKKEDKKTDSKDKRKKDELVVKIDFEGIQDRIISIPVPERRYQEIGFSENKIFYSYAPIKGSLSPGWYDMDGSPQNSLRYFDLVDLKENDYCFGVSDFIQSQDKTKLLVDFGGRIRLLDTKSAPGKDVLSISQANNKSGLINFERAKVEIVPTDEWRQMYAEAWRLQRDYFWVKNMSGINWKKIFTRYDKLIDRVGTKSEFSDLAWEMQGELGTSHAYEFGGDYRHTRPYRLGHLGADFKLHSKGYEIIKIVKGDTWTDSLRPPLLRPGLKIKKGMIITHIDGKKLTKTYSPNHALVNKSSNEVVLKIFNPKKNITESVNVQTIISDQNLRYRDWVENNRDYVHKKTKNKVGYIHIPDMGPEGFAEFHRYFLTELDYDGLVIDVRFNGGGHVSPLILSKLARKRIGYDLTRWMGDEPYPGESVAGPMIALTNENAGSDGDIFSHSFKLMGLGKLIGRRTWGGVIGIWPRNALVDGTLTTQPEFSFWFKDVGWNVENYGTDVDLEVNNLPKDYKRNIDTQLDKAIELIQEDVKKAKLIKPDYKNKPNLKLPN